MLPADFVCHACSLNSFVCVEELPQEETLINIPRNTYSNSYLTIYFNLNIQEQFWYTQPNDFQLVLVHRESRCPTNPFHVLLRPLSHERLYRLVSEVIGNLSSEYEDFHQAIFEDTIRQVLTITEKESSEGRRILKVSVDVTFVVDHVCDDMILLASEELSDGMVPASKSSIELLEQMDVDERNCNDECMVCLDKIGGETDVLCLPCSHMFHAECITKWLQKSHYCPLCRFELPTD